MLSFKSPAAYEHGAVPVANHSAIDVDLPTPADNETPANNINDNCASINPIDDCVIDIQSDNDDDHADSDDSTMNVPTLPPIVPGLPKNWTQGITLLNKKRKNLNYPHYYYFNAKASEVSWIPVMLHLHQKAASATTANLSKPTGIDKSNARTNQYFHTQRPPPQTMEAALNNE